MQIRSKITSSVIKSRTGKASIHCNGEIGMISFNHATDELQFWISDDEKGREYKVYLSLKDVKKLLESPSTNAARASIKKEAGA